MVDPNIGSQFFVAVTSALVTSALTSGAAIMLWHRSRRGERRDHMAAVFGEWLGVAHGAASRSYICYLKYLDHVGNILWNNDNLKYADVIPIDQDKEVEGIERMKEETLDLRVRLDAAFSVLRMNCDDNKLVQQIDGVTQLLKHFPECVMMDAAGCLAYERMKGYKEPPEAFKDVIDDLPEKPQPVIRYRYDCMQLMLRDISDQLATYIQDTEPLHSLE